MDLTKTPSWPKAVTAKAAWDMIRETSAPEDKKAPLRDAYVQATEQCLREAGMF